MVRYHNLGHTLAVTVYGLSVAGVFTSSTLHHASTSRRLKNIFLWLDHSCIYTLIAGTYTPFMVVLLRRVMWVGLRGDEVEGPQLGEGGGRDLGGGAGAQPPELFGGARFPVEAILDGIVNGLDPVAGPQWGNPWWR